LWPGVVARGTAYLAGQFVRASNPAGGTFAADFDDRIYECTSAGTTHATVQPSYDPTVGTTTTDGSAVFTAREGFTRASEVALVDNDREFDADAALAGIGQPGWAGADLYESTDGAFYALIDEGLREMAWGVTRSAMPDTETPFRTDRDSELSVTMVTGSLSSATEMEMLNGANSRGSDSSNQNDARRLIAQTYALGLPNPYGSGSSYNNTRGLKMKVQT
jgi:hypothetical protein